MAAAAAAGARSVIRDSPCDFSANASMRTGESDARARRGADLPAVPVAWPAAQPSGPRSHASAIRISGASGVDSQPGMVGPNYNRSGWAWVGAHPARDRGRCWSGHGPCRIRVFAQTQASLIRDGPDRSDPSRAESGKFSSNSGQPVPLAMDPALYLLAYTAGQPEPGLITCGPDSRPAPLRTGKEACPQPVRLASPGVGVAGRLGRLAGPAGFQIDMGWEGAGMARRAWHMFGPQLCIKRLG